MIRLIIVVEGRTEREFVSSVLAPHLSAYGVLATARVLGKPGHQGGNVAVDRIAADVRNIVSGAEALTTLVDFYGFRRRPTDDIDELEDRINAACRNAIDRPLREDRVFAYVQRHEFEALLFSDPAAFGRALTLPAGAEHVLRSIRSSFETPEDINDSPATAPSKRNEDVYPRYNKTIDGILVAAEVGLDKMRAECPRFRHWLSRLEALGSQARS